MTKAEMKGPGFRRLTRDPDKYEAMVQKTLDDQIEAIEKISGERGMANPITRGIKREKLKRKIRSAYHRIVQKSGDGRDPTSDVMEYKALIAEWQRLNEEELKHLLPPTSQPPPKKRTPR